MLGFSETKKNNNSKQEIEKKEGFMLYSEWMSDFIGSLKCPFMMSTLQCAINGDWNEINPQPQSHLFQCKDGMSINVNTICLQTAPSVGWESSFFQTHVSSSGLKKPQSIHWTNQYFFLFEKSLHLPTLMRWKLGWF